MLIRNSFFILFILTLISSCKKEELSFDKEGDLQTDTATMVFRAQIISNSLAQLNIELDLLTFNDLSSEQEYANFTLVEAFSNADIIFNSDINYPEQYAEITNYSTVFLINEDEKNFYRDFTIGFYLKRYLEQIEADPNKKYGISSFGWQNNKGLSIYSENQNGYTSNSLEYSMSKFYESTYGPVDVSANPTTDITYFTIQINALIDSIAASPEFTGDKSITIMSGPNIEGGSLGNVDIDTTIARANAQGIRINMIGNGFPSNFMMLAYRTGGFVSSPLRDISAENNPGFWEESRLSDVAIFMQNLDALLSRRVNVHHFELILTSTSGPTYTSGKIIYLNLLYNNRTVEIQVIIP